MKTSTIITLALVGTAVTLLFTTEKGRSYRDAAIDGAKDWGKKLRRQAEDLSDKAAESNEKLAKALA